MYKAVRAVIEKHHAVWESLPAFIQSRDAFIEKLDTLEQKSFAQSLALVGVSAAKNAIRQISAERTYAISSGIVAYAVINNNVALLEQMKVGKIESTCSGTVQRATRFHNGFGLVVGRINFYRCGVHKSFVLEPLHIRKTEIVELRFCRRMD